MTLAELCQRMDDGYKAGRSAGKTRTSAPFLPEDIEFRYAVYVGYAISTGYDMGCREAIRETQS